MPRITPLRILLSLPLWWFSLVLLWAALPSPQYSWNNDPSDYLWRGGTLTRVYDVDNFFRYNDPLPSVQDARSTGRLSFALDYKYDADTGELLIGDSHSFDLGTLLSSSTPYVSDPFVIRVKTGDEDGINLPWFSPADSALLFWEIHRDIAEIPLRLTVVNETTVLIRPLTGLGDPYQSDLKGEATAFPPLLTMQFDSSKDSSNQHAQPWHFHVELPQSQRNSSPTRTFVLRRAISAIMVPTYFFVADYVLGPMSSTFPIIIGLVQVLFWAVAIYVVLVLTCWKASRQPRFWPWTRTFWLTRGVTAYLGPRLVPSGEDPGDDSGTKTTGASEYNEADEMDGPQPLHSAWAFFKSSSPLDDLLVTFEATRSLVQPLHLTLRRRRADEESGIVADSSSSTRSDESVDGLVKGGGVSAGDDQKL